MRRRIDGHVSRELPLPDRKMLWALAANRCSYRDCRAPLVRGLHIVAEEAHIVAASEGCPRWDLEYPADQLHGYYNRILLCPTHHTLIDKDIDGHPAELLLAMKADHEAWVEQTLGNAAPDPVEMTYAYLVDGWRERFIDGAGWTVTAAVARPRMRMHRATLDSFSDAVRWMYSRVYPGRHIALEAELRRFELVAISLQNLLAVTLEQFRESDSVWFEPLYKYSHDEDGSFERYDWLHSLTCDLAYELGRCANAVAQAVRETIDPMFMIDAGLVLVGEEDGFGSAPVRVSYAADERIFEDLPTFLADRSSRDRHVGAGINIDALRQVWPGIAEDLERSE